MKFTHTNDYYKEINVHKNCKYKYRLTYVGSYMYQLTRGKYKVLYKSHSFKDIYRYIYKHNINLKEIHMPYMTLYEFLKYWVTFEPYEKNNRF